MDGFSLMAKLFDIEQQAIAATIKKWVVETIEDVNNEFIKEYEPRAKLMKEKMETAQKYNVVQIAIFISFVIVLLITFYNFSKNK